MVTGPSKGGMFRFQDGLERLPVPTLDESCSLYLELVAPLLSATELAATSRAVAQFAEPGGRGEELQRRLTAWSEDRANWLEPFWDDWYLCDETPLPINVSPGFSLRGTGRSQAARAAGLLAAALRFDELVSREDLEPDVVAGVPQCMAEYPRVCSSTRIPGTTRDRLERFPQSRHVVVVRGNRFFSLDVRDEDGRAYPTSNLELALRQLLADPGPRGPGVGVLTADKRRTWAATREEHFVRGEPEARELVRAVEQAVLVLVLEHEPGPESALSDDAARLFLHGDARGRWFDKSIQLIVAPSGVAGFCMEHAGFDASTAGRFARFLAEHEHEPSRSAARPALEPREHRFDPNPSLLAAVGRSQRAADRLIGRTELAVLDFEGFGKRAVGERGVSPDGFVQMAFQLACFSLTGETASTYEAVSTKRFLHGRTEAMRSVSAESVEFVSALRGRRPSDPATAEKLLRWAVARHTAIVARCKAGRGVERHLLGLRRMLELDEPLPSLFADSAYTKLTRSVLSTSSVRSTPGVELACFGPVVDEGFGLAYTIHDQSMTVAVTNFHGLAKDFAGELERALVDMGSLLSDPPHR